MVRGPTQCRSYSDSGRALVTGFSAESGARLTRRQVARLSNGQRAAYDQLHYGVNGPAARARLKMELGWRRSREETLALARELLAAGRTRLEAADEIGIRADYLDRILDRSDPPEISPKNQPVCRGVSGLTGGVGVNHRPAPPPAGFASFAELDRWLEEHP